MGVRMMMRKAYGCDGWRFRRVSSSMFLEPSEWGVCVQCVVGLGGWIVLCRFAAVTMQGFLSHATGTCSSSSLCRVLSTQNIPEKVRKMLRCFYWSALFFSDYPKRAAKPWPGLALGLGLGLLGSRLCLLNIFQIPFVSAQHGCNPVCVCPTSFQSRLCLPNMAAIPFVSAQHLSNPVCVCPTWLQSRLCYRTSLESHSCLPNIFAVPFVFSPNIFAIPFVSTQHLWNPVCLLSNTFAKSFVST